MANIETIKVDQFNFAEVAAPSTPASGQTVVYAKTDGKVYAKDDAGNEYDLTAGSGASVAGDAIWDAAGDLAVGTGANTASRLAVGSIHKVPKSDGTTLAYAYATKGLAHYALPLGLALSDTVGAGANLGTSGGALAVPIPVPAMMSLDALLYRNNDTATARSMEWGLYYDDGTTSSPRVASGTDSFTPTVASNRSSSATSGPVLIEPGMYWLVLRNTGGATNFQITVVSAGATNLGIVGVQTKTLGSALGSTLDLSTGWTRSSNNLLLAALKGRVFGEGAAFA